MKNKLKEVINNDFNKERNYQEIMNKKSKNKYYLLIPITICFLISVFITNYVLNNKEVSFNNDTININDLNSSFGYSDYLDIYIYTKEYDKDTLFNKFTFLNKVWLPKGYSLYNVLEITNEDKTLDSGEYYINYKDNNENNSLSINISKNDYGRARCINPVFNNISSSYINGYEVKLVSFDNNYIALLKMNDYYIDIELRINNNEEDFIKVVKSILD